MSGGSLPNVNLPAGYQQKTMPRTLPLHSYIIRVVENGTKERSWD
jgi:hypothetical protein